MIEINKHYWPVKKCLNQGIPPYGYHKSDDNKMWVPEPHLLDALETAKVLLQNGQSTRSCMTWLEGETGKRFSHQGFIKRTKRDNILFDTWTQMDYGTWKCDETKDGKAVLAESNWKARPQGNGRRKRQERLRGKTPEEKAIIKQKQTMQSAKATATRSKNKLKTLLKESTKDAVREIIPEEIHQAVADDLQMESEEAALLEEIIFRPNPGPQTDFLASIEDVIFYGGAKGGGKSYALIADPLRYCVHSKFRAIILRRTMPELRDMIRHTQEIYPKVYPGARFLKSEKTWEFPSGATLEFGYCETEEDAERYRGQSFHWVGIDELPQYAHRGPFDALMSCLRSVHKDIPPMMRCTGNPGNIGSGWVKREFIDVAPPNTTFYKTAEITDPRTGESRIVSKSFKYIPATVYDNPYLIEDDSYLASLALLPEIKRKQMLEGNWDVIDMGAFPDFDRSLHVIKPFEIPGNWLTFRAADWGFASPFCVLWFAVDYNENVYVFREWYDQGIYDSDWAAQIATIEQENKIFCEHGVIDGSISTSRGSKAEDSFVIINKILARNRLAKFRKADRSPGSRKEGKLAVHRMLALKETGRFMENGEPELSPSLFIFENCTDLIRTLPALLTDPNDPEVVLKKNSEDHAYDALHYGLRSIRNNARRVYAAMDSIRNNRPAPADAVFGY